MDVCLFPYCSLKTLCRLKHLHRNSLILDRFGAAASALCIILSLVWPCEGTSTCVMQAIDVPERRRSPPHRLSQHSLLIATIERLPILRLTPMWSFDLTPNFPSPASPNSQYLSVLKLDPSYRQDLLFPLPENY